MGNIWQKKYTLHNEDIDKQHEYLFQLADQASSATSKDTEINCAMSLFKHMREHFRDEEQLMKQTDYPALNVHVAAHNELLDILVGISDSIANSNSFRTLHDFMQSKFLTHTLSLDIEFGKFQSQYLSEKNSKPGK